MGHSLGGAVATALAERLGDDVAALVLIAPAGFGRIHVAEAIQLPGVRTVVRHGLPLALMNPVTALGVYMAVVGNGQLPDPEHVARLRKNAHRWAPGAACANEAITASGRSRRAFYRRELDYHGPVLALWGEHDRLVPLAHRDGVMTAFPQARGQRLEEDGPPSPARTSARARTVHRSRLRPRPSERARRRDRPSAPDYARARGPVHAASAVGWRGRVARHRLARSWSGRREAPTPRGMADWRWFSPADPTVTETRLERVIRRAPGQETRDGRRPDHIGVFAPAIVALSAGVSVGPRGHEPPKERERSCRLYLAHIRSVHDSRYGREPFTSAS